MKILVINPNSTASMTEKIGQCAQEAASAGTVIEAVNPTDSPPAIQGAEDGDAALPHLFELFEKATSEGAWDAIIIACFDDTGLGELKNRSRVPVIGIGEAAFHCAMLLGARCCVVTTLPVSVPVIEKNINEYGFSSRITGVRASDIPVLDLERRPDESFQRLSEEVAEAIRKDPECVIALGCAGMADLASKLAEKHSVPVVDGVKSAVGLAEVLVRA